MDDLEEWQWTITSWTRWWLYLKLLYQMWCHYLSKSMHHLVCNPWYLVCSYWSVKWFFLLFFVNKANSKQLLSVVKASNTITILPQGYINSLDLCYDLDCRDLDHCFHLQNTILIHHIGDTILIEPREKEVVTTPELLARHVHAREWEKKCDEISELQPDSGILFSERNELSSQKRT